MKKINHGALALAALVLIVCAFGIRMTVAWFVTGDRFGAMSLTIAKINSTVTLYTAEDINYNGVPDLLDTAEQYNYYLDRYKFNYQADDVALNAEPTSVKLEMAITDAFPSRVYTYKLALVNKGDATNTVSVKFDALTYTADGDLTAEQKARFLSTLSVKTGRIGVDGNVTFDPTGKIYLKDSLNGTSFAGVTLIPGIEIYGIIEAVNPSDNCVDFWIQIEMEPYSVLAGKYGGDFMTKDEYNALQGTAVVFPRMLTYFEVTQG